MISWKKSMDRMNLTLFLCNADSQNNLPNGYVNISLTMFMRLYPNILRAIVLRSRVKRISKYAMNSALPEKQPSWYPMRNRRRCIDQPT
mmetsp:Transcript_36791/g.77658  ORF Transcript_36791/g.77658 Transcript_36791/m.77658 type:complete len:89 (+) Transcript_36791:69-335(+)